ncbi:Mitochondrial substrate carrier family protein isoform 1 [Tripterygium wilfordii]|uniref:Mitochondrial substrate carrier family protein isoform 1 n=1 Tax=Tripterygium wilfordii TaxID=458696 RepID=A0A7J7CIC2_TRIWF|nr:Mitochondrial substrate carrier family protein isoform 1 [Tripterygium wilfordii]
MIMESASVHPAESFFNSIQVAFSPLESGIRKAVKDLETCWAGPKNKAKSLELVNGVNISDSDSKIQIFALKKNSNGCNGQSVVNTEEKKKKGGLSIKVPIKNLLGLKGKDLGNQEWPCMNYSRFAVTWNLLVTNFVLVFPSPFKISKKKSQENGDENKWNSRPCKHSNSMKSSKVQWEVKNGELKGDQSATLSNTYVVNHRDGNHVSLEFLIGFIYGQLVQNLQKLDQGKETEQKRSLPLHPPPTSQFDHLGALMSIWEGRKADVNGFLGNLKFARVGGTPTSFVGVSSLVGEESDNGVNSGNTEGTGDGSQQKGDGGLLSIPPSNVESLKSTLSTVSFAELIELVPHLGQPSKDYPDKKKLISVQDFFRYTESEGRRFFEELDRDGDGQVNLEDLEIAITKRKLPRRYAREFMRRARSHLFSTSFGWKQFLSLMEQREPTILRAYTSLCLSKSGTLQKSELLPSLKNAGLPANEDSALAMMRFLNADTEESISYGHFRDFMLLLPSDRLQDDPRNIRFEDATVVAVAPPVELPAENVLKSALAGGLSCAFSAFLMHPTHVQASTALTFSEIISQLPQIGIRGLYKGSIPAILGQFSSHGLRTGLCEASKLVLINVAPTLPDIQVQSISSFCSTVLGTAARIPCEVLKQRLQAGIFDNVGEAIVGTWQQDGLKGFFRGTGATLCRELPFYVAGMGLYTESKKAAQVLLGRKLEPWEVITVGALSGGLAGVTTTPFDVIKTRMMTAGQGRPLSMTMVAFSILRHEGLLALYKGAVPRFFWIAPLGAMNFAGYELARRAMG